MFDPDTELRFVSSAIGWGVFATRFIPRDTITWALDLLDQRFTSGERAALPAYARAQLEKYSYVDARGDYVLCWPQHNASGRPVMNPDRPLTVPLRENRVFL